MFLLSAGNSFLASVFHLRFVEFMQFCFTKEKICCGRVRLRYFNLRLYYYEIALHMYNVLFENNSQNLF